LRMRCKGPQCVNFSSTQARMNHPQPSAQYPHDIPWLDAAAFGLVLCDENLTVRRANARGGQMLGLAAGAMEGRHLLNLLELPEPHAAQALQALGQREPWLGLSRSGERALKVEIRATAGGAVASLIDYSADLEQLQRLTDAKTLAERSNEARSQFLQHMSHELRTPLNAIIGFTQLLKISRNVDERERDNIAEIEKAGASLLALINEVLELSKIEAGKLKLSDEHVDLRALAEECLQLVAPLAQPRGIGMSTHIAEGSLLVADYVRLKQVLLNLLSNAVKYNHDGGAVSVHCIAMTQRHLRIEIRDSGVGIAPEHLQTIFSPFDRLGSIDSIDNSGIGLMITRRLVTLMQGQIGVFSLPERGSVFWVELPRTRQSLAGQAIDSIQEHNQDHNAPVHASNLPPRGPLFWIGAHSALYAALDGLRELRPMLRLRHYETVAEARRALSLEQPGLVFVHKNLAGDPELIAFMTQAGTNPLKQVPFHVVTGNRGKCRNSSAVADSGAPFALQVPDDTRLTALLDLLDRYMNQGLTTP
jgi:signal transduction histidine kinase